MKYALLIYSREADWDNLSEDEEAAEPFLRLGEHERRFLARRLDEVRRR